MTFQKGDRVKILDPSSKYYQQVGTIAEEIIAEWLYFVQLGNEGIAGVLCIAVEKKFLQKVEDNKLI